MTREEIQKRLSGNSRDKTTHARKFKAPKSFCKCGHTGDGPFSDHRMGKGGVAPGHGACHVRTCKCKLFTWEAYTQSFLIHMTRMDRDNRRPEDKENMNAPREDGEE